MFKTSHRAKRARDFKRRPAFRPERERILIVTEGSKTEPAYFRLLIEELGLTTANVQILSDGDSAPISVVRYAKSFLKKDSDFEHIYCVFDRDKHPSYRDALNLALKFTSEMGRSGKNFLAITSIPCFEIWYFLHVSNARKPYNSAGSPADALISDLKKQPLFVSYEKHNCASFFRDIAQNREEAIRRSELFLREAQREGAKEHEENPSTRVHLVVRSLIELAKSH